MIKTVREIKERAQALLDSFEILHKHFMESKDQKTIDVLEKAQKDILNLL